MASLKEILQQVTQETTGTVVTETGSVDIAPSVAGEPVDIKSSDGTVTLSIADNGEISFGDGQVIRKVVSVINDADPDNATNLSNVAAIVARINSAVSGTLTFDKIDSKAEFDTFLAQTVIVPSTVLVTDPAPFDYTDTNGKVNTDIDYWLGIVTKPTAGDTLSTTTQSTSQSTNTQSGAEIKIALFSEPDTNNLDDIRASIVDSIVNTVTTGLDNKVDIVSGQGLSTNNYDNASKSKVDNVPGDTNVALANKISIDAQDVNFSITNNGTGNGSFSLINTQAPVDQRTFTITPRSNGHFDIEARDDAGTIQHEWVFTHGGVTNFPGQITQSGNNVLDVSDSKYSNLPTNTTLELSNKENSIAGFGLTENNYTDTEKSKLAGLSNFNGGTITDDLAITNNNYTALSLIALSNTDSRTGIAWRNSGASYFASLHRIQGANNFGALQLSVGLESDIADLVSSVKFNRDQSIEMSGTLDVVGGISTDGIISSTGNNTAANYTASNQGEFSVSNAGAPINSRNSRTTHDSDGNFVIELVNDLGNVLKSYKFGASGIAEFPGNFQCQSLNNSGASFVGSNLTVEGDASLANDADIGNDASVNRNLTVGNESIIVGGLSVGSNISPTNALDVYGAMLVVGDALFKGNLTLEDISQNNFTFERALSGIQLRAELNPEDGDPIFQVLSSGSSARLRVEHEGALSTSNKIVKVGTASNGSGGSRLARIRDKHYYTSFPTVSLLNIIDDWLGSGVYFVGTGSGTVTLPLIVESNPTETQLEVGNYFEIFNFNSDSAITLSPEVGQNIWFRDYVTDVVTGNISLGSKQGFRITVADFTETDIISNNFGFMVSQLYEFA